MPSAGSRGDDRGGATPTFLVAEARLDARSSTVEAPVTLVINLILFGAIILVPLGISFVFMRLRRRFSTHS